MSTILDIAIAAIRTVVVYLVMVQLEANVSGLLTFLILLVVFVIAFLLHIGTAIVGATNSGRLR